MPDPVRLQLSRRKGFKLAAASRAANGLEAVSVARPGRWGNPYRIELIEEGRFIIGRRVHDAMADHDTDHGAEAVAETAEAARAQAVILFARFLASPWGAHMTRRIRRDLAGLNLACFCPLDGPCHGDVLLRVARGESPLAPGLIGDALEIVGEYNRGDLHP